MGCVGKPFFRILKNNTFNVQYSVFLKEKLHPIKGGSTQLSLGYLFFSASTICDAGVDSFG
jgi:hypothetical protein